MFQELRGFLNPAEVARLTQLAGELSFVEGRLSNPNNVTKVNLQADRRDPRYGESAQIVLGRLPALAPVPRFRLSQDDRPAAFQPLRAGHEIRRPCRRRLYERRRAGPAPSSCARTLSCTIFLNDPASYEGGELVLHVGTLPVPIKGQPGEAFVYPSTLLHEVRPVTVGRAAGLASPSSKA